MLRQLAQEAYSKYRAKQLCSSRELKKWILQSNPMAEKLGHGLPRELFIMWLDVGCLQSGSICSSSILSWAQQLPLSSTAVDYGPLGGNAVLKWMCNAGARIWDPLKAHCSSCISLKEIRNQMSFFFVVTSSYMQTNYYYYFFIYYILIEKIESLWLIWKVSLLYSAADYFGWMMAFSISSNEKQGC